MDSGDAFNELYDSCVKTYCANNIQVPSVDSRNAKRTRTSSQNIFNSKDSFQTKYDKILDHFIIEIQERFRKSNLEPVLELYKLIMNDDEKININYDKLIIYNQLINLNELKYEVKAYIEYKKRNEKIQWHIMNELIQEFVKNDLKTPFRQIYLCLKLYLTVPVSTAEGERSFSVLKLLKDSLRTTMLQERFSELAIIKMNSDTEIDLEEIINEFAKLKNRNLDFY